jgi:hypothetical protein
LAACGSSASPDASDVATNDVISVDAADVANDMQVADGSDGSDASSSDAGSVGTGSVSVEVAVPLMMANFFVGFLQGASNCAQRTEGPCTVKVCQADAGTAPVAVSAGDVTASGGTGAPIVAHASSSASYSAGLPMPASRWHAGDMVTISAAGDTVPAFSVMLPFPSALAMTTPAAPGNSFPPFDHTMDLAFTWSPTTGSNDAHIVIQQSRPDAGVTVACRFDRSAGTGTVPAAAMSDLQPGMAIVVAEAQNAQTVMAGGFAVNVRTASIAMLSIGTVQ